MRLILCAGDRLIKGYTTHDVKPMEGIDIVCDLLDIGKHVAPESCEDIKFTHALEHFPTKEVPNVLQLIKGLLKPNGTLYIEVPNFAWHAELVGQGEDEKAVYYCFGGQLDEWDFHKTGFTPSILFNRLTEAGFRNVQVENGSSLTARCTK